MSDVLGLTLTDGRIDGVVVRRRLGRARVLGTVSVEAGEGAGDRLRERLAERGLRPRHLHVGLPRSLAVVKVIELPAVAGADLGRMVGFEAERHLPYPAGEAAFGWEALAPAPGGPLRVLLVATERRLVDRMREVARGLGATLRVVDVAVHDLARRRARGDRAAAALLVRLEPDVAEIAVTRGGRVAASRTVALGEEPEERSRTLRREVERTLGLLAPEVREAVAAVRVVGEVPAGFEVPGLAVASGADLPPGSDEAPPAALAVALRRAADPRLANLLPAEARPRPFPWHAAGSAALLVLTLALAAGRPAASALRAERTLAGLDAAVARLRADVQRVEQLAAQVERARREAATLRAFEERGVRGLAVLRELTELLPADVWLTSLSADRNGVELIGFAAAASQLIPLLEGSPRLERVEFTSPVTKGQDREQFRLRAAWEQPGPPPAAGSPPARPLPGGPAPPPARSAPLPAGDKAP